MRIGIKRLTLAAVIGVSFAAIALPAMAENRDDYRRGDCPNHDKDMGKQHMNRDGMERGMRPRMRGGDDTSMRPQRGDRWSMSRGMGGGNMMRRFSIIDQNEDGRISDDEAAAQREFVFAAMDTDDDQELTMEEFMGVSMGQGEGGNAKRVEKRQEAKKARFTPMDSDGSGKVSIAEWMAEGQKRFESADSDNDGIVTPWEFRSRGR